MLPTFVHSLRGLIQRSVEELLDRVQDQGHIDASGDFAFLLPAHLRAGVGTAHVVFVLALLSAAATLPAAAADSVQTQHHYPVLRKFWRFFDVALQQKYLAGNWAGLRDELESAGVTSTATRLSSISSRQ